MSYVTDKTKQKAGIQVRSYGTSDVAFQGLAYCTGISYLFRIACHVSPTAQPHEHRLVRVVTTAGSRKLVRCIFAMRRISAIRC